MLSLDPVFCYWPYWQRPFGPLKLYRRTANYSLLLSPPHDRWFLMFLVLCPHVLSQAYQRLDTPRKKNKCNSNHWNTIFKCFRGLKGEVKQRFVRSLFSSRFVFVARQTGGHFLQNDLERSPRVDFWSSKCAYLDDWRTNTVCWHLTNHWPLEAVLLPLWISHPTGHQCSPLQGQRKRLVLNNSLSPTGMSALTHPLQYISGKDHDIRIEDHEGTVSIRGGAITNLRSC